jgi:hypothetical protein
MDSVSDADFGGHGNAADLARKQAAARENVQAARKRESRERSPEADAAYWRRVFRDDLDRADERLRLANATYLSREQFRARVQVGKLSASQIKRRKRS